MIEKNKIENAEYPISVDVESIVDELTRKLIKDILSITDLPEYLQNIILNIYYKFAYNMIHTNLKYYGSDVYLNLKYVSNSYVGKWQPLQKELIEIYYSLYIFEIPNLYKVI